MCLSVYLGTTRPLAIKNVPLGHLGVEKASWTPPPLSKYEFIYYLGAKSPETELACSCLLAEQVEWTAAGAVVHADATYPEEDPCPFEELKALCDGATRDGGFATIVCDDSNSLEQTCTEEDYCISFIRLGSIARGNLIFADVNGAIPWRVLHVVR